MALRQTLILAETRVYAETGGREAFGPGRLRRRAGSGSEPPLYDAVDDRVYEPDAEDEDPIEHLQCGIRRIFRQHS